MTARSSASALGREQRRQVLGVSFQVVVGVAPQHHRIQPQRVAVHGLRIGRERALAGHLDVFGAVRRRDLVDPRLRGPDLQLLLCLRAQRLHRPPMTAQGVVRGQHDLGETQLIAGRVAPDLHPRPDEHLRLVERHPGRHAIRQLARDDLGVVAEPIGDVAVQKTAAVIDPERQIPVIERRPGRDPAASNWSTRRS